MLRILLALAFWLAAPAALAHAVLLETVPPADAELEVAPEAVVLRFNEPVSPVTIRLLDASGTTVAEGGVSRDTSVVLPLPALRDGRYILTWRVVSTDSHPVGGSFRFAVGTGVTVEVPAAEVTARHGADWRGVATLHRALYLSVLLFATGGAGFLAATGGRLPVRDRVAPMLVVGALLALGLVPVQGLLLLAMPLAELAPRDVLAAGLASSVARGGIASAALLAIAAALLARWPVAAALAALGAVATLGLSGHAATAGPRWLAAPSLALHAGLAALWAGALLPLRASLAHLPAGEGAALLRAFSRRAVAGVAALIVAGGVLVLIQVRHPAGMFTPYGGVLALKLAGVAALLAVALWNRNRLTPALAAGDPRARRRLRQSIGVEIGLMLVVVASVALLSQLTPPRALTAVGEHRHDHAEAGLDHHHHDHHAPTAGQAVRLEAEDRGHRMNAGVTGLSGGGHAMELTFTHRDGSALEPSEVEVAMSLPEQGVEPILRAPERGGDGYVLRTQDMALPGRWRIEVVALVSDFERARFLVELPIDTGE